MTRATNLKPMSGFTIVELLIVVVVIAILAAITIVSYNGITNQANTSAAKSTASTVAKKSEAYFADTNNVYPSTLASLTGAASSASWAIAPASVTLDSTALSTSNPASKPSEVNFYKCGHTGSTTAVTTTASITTVTGAQVVIWNFTTKAAETTSMGITSGMGGPTNTYPIGCAISAS